jgi:hypothetical protein
MFLGEHAQHLQPWTDGSTAVVNVWVGFDRIRWDYPEMKVEERDYRGGWFPCALGRQEEVEWPPVRCVPPLALRGCEKRRRGKGSGHTIESDFGHWIRIGRRK